MRDRNVSYADDQLLAISGLQHLAFCERQCALIHLEQTWHENVLTALGNLMHERVHSDESTTRGDLRVARGLPLTSKRLGLVGVADVVEFHRDDTSTLVLPKQRGAWRVYPVEYKRGQKKKDNVDAVQLCAQALCLEEMLGVAIAEGSLYYGQTRNRVVVPLDAALRSETESLAARFHNLMEQGDVPPPKFASHCKSCSLVDECQPNVSASASAYLEKMIAEVAS
ncbi:MAG: CRISPR-associated protein Cas4 [Thermoguttaceae bacterium]